MVLGVGSVLVGQGSLTAGGLIAFVLFADLLFSPIQQLSQVFDAYQQARASMEKINELMHVETLTPPCDDPVSVGALAGEVRLVDVHFSYPGITGAAEALSGVDLTIRPKETVALVGETGAGKSTVMKLVARFYDPTAGTVLVDGHDLRRLDLGAFRRQLGYVPQEAFLFSGSIRDNIAYGRPEASDAEVEQAARAVGAHDFIAGVARWLPQCGDRTGPEPFVGPAPTHRLGPGPVGGPCHSLLDEATSNLDLGTEAKVSRGHGHRRPGAARPF